MMHTEESERQFFAGMALQGLLAATIDKEKLQLLADGVMGGRFYAEAAWAIADKMIETESNP